MPHQNNGHSADGQNRPISAKKITVTPLTSVLLFPVESLILAILKDDIVKEGDVMQFYYPFNGHNILLAYKITCIVPAEFGRPVVVDDNTLCQILG